MFTSSVTPRRSASAPHAGPAICVPIVSSTGHGHASIKGIHLAEGKFDAASITAVLTPKNSAVPVNEIYYYLMAHKEELLVPMMRGATNKSLNVDRLKDLSVPLLDAGSSEGRAIRKLMDQKRRIQDMESEIKRLRQQHNESVERLRNSVA